MGEPTDDRVLVVMTGLPGSGKTTWGRTLAAELGLPFFDKDDILETLFDQLEVAGVDDRQRLSRASDAVLETVVATSGSAVVASHWRREELSVESGTPTAWLGELADTTVVEVHCGCTWDLAAERFLARDRHPGHHDSARSSADLVAQLQSLAALGPWGLGGLVEVDTSGAVDVNATAAAVRFLSVDRLR